MPDVKAQDVGAAKLKPMKVEMEVSNAKTGEVAYYINQIANQYADFAVQKVDIAQNKIAFEMGSLQIENLKPSDIKWRIEEFLTLNVAPFTLRTLKVSAYSD